MSADIKSQEFDQKTMQDVNEALTALRKAAESNTLAKSEIKEIEAKCEERLSKFDAANTKFVGALKEEEKKVKQLEDTLVDMETKMSRIPLSDQAHAQCRRDIDAFTKFIRVGETWKMPMAPHSSNAKHLFFEDAEIKLLRTDVNDQGGFLVPEDFRAEILKFITEISPIRQIARNMTTSAAELVLPSRKTLVNTQFVGEAGTVTESNSTYGEERIKVNKMVTDSAATIEMLNDSAFDIELEIRRDVAESMAEEEGKAFVNGDSVNRPEGFMFNTSIPFIVSGIADDIQGDNLIDLTGELKRGQRPIFALNRRTIARVRKLKDLDGAYLFNAGVAGLESAMPATIVGFPFIEVIDMPDIAADSFPIIFGDFGRGYIIANGFDLTMIRDPFTRAKQCIICFIWKRGLGGQVVLTDAFVKLKVST